jgi:ribosomal protein L40E
MDQISTGKCDDLVISELMVAVSELADPTEKELILTALKDIALKSGNAASVAASIKSLLAFTPMEMGLEDTLEIRILELITSKIAFSNRALQEAMAEFLYLRISGRVDRAAPFVDALIQFLDERAGTGGTTAYNSLMIVAANRPEYFQQHAGLLIKMLGSINTATRIQTTRIIAVLAMSHPEYVAGAEKTLLHLSSFNPDGELKNSASEALQILSSKLRPDEPTPIDDMERRRREEPDTSGSLAEIMRRRMSKDKKAPYESRIDKRLLSMATNFARKADRAYKTEGDGVGPEESDAEAINKIMDDFSDIAQSIKAEAQPVAKAEIVEAAQPEVRESEEEIELRRMMERVKDDFSINAGSILDAIGMGHLARKAMMDEVKPRPAEVPVRDRPKRARLTRTEPARHEHAPEKPPAKKMAEEEEDVSPKEFIASIESIISRTEKDHAGLASSPAAPDAAGPVAPAENVATASLPAPETTDMEPPVPAETALPAAPPEATKQVIPAFTQPGLPRPLKTPVAPSGVRISAMKFKSIDQSKSRKTPTPPKISIKPHIKPLNKTPIDGIKTAQMRQHPLASAPLAPRGLEPRAEALPGEIVCHSCNAKMPEDSQRCAICGSDLKAPKVRCRKCGEINPRGGGKCNRCGSGMDE